MAQKKVKQPSLTAMTSLVPTCPEPTLMAYMNSSAIRDLSMSELTMTRQPLLSHPSVHGGNLKGDKHIQKPSDL